MKKENMNVRRAARAAGVPLYAIARELGISEPTMQRWLRFPLPEDKEQRIMSAISALEKDYN